MHNKKILSAIGALAVSVTLIGGTLAWFSSQDDVKNIFKTGELVDVGGDGKGVEIYEEFEAPNNITPGTTTTKLVQVQNTTTYDSFIRVKIIKSWENTNGTNGQPLELDKIVLNWTEDSFDDDATDGYWIYGEDGYYYYIGKVKGKGFTKSILDSVTLHTSADLNYTGQQYNVEVIADSIQASNGAVEAEWGGEDKSQLVQSIVDKLTNLESETINSIDAGQLDYVDVTKKESYENPDSVGGNAGSTFRK